MKIIKRQLRRIIREADDQVRLLTPEELEGLSPDNIAKMADIEKGGKGISIKGKPRLDASSISTMATLEWSSSGRTCSMTAATPIVIWILSRIL